MRSRRKSPGVDGRQTNRTGKTGSHILRRLLKSLPPREKSGNAASGSSSSRIALPQDSISARGSFADVCMPLMAVGSPLQKQLMVSACKYFCPGTDPKGGSFGDDEGVAQTCDRFLFTPSRPQSSLKSEADSINYKRGVLHNDLLTTASAVWQAGTGAWNLNLSKICNMIRAGACRGVALLKCRVYDETPLKVRVEPESTQTRAMFGSKGDQCIAKIMQTRFKIGCVIEDRRSQDLFYFSGIVPTVLQALERTRGEDIARSQSDILSSVPELDRAAEMFNVCVDISVTDRYLANAKAEAELQALRPQDIPLHVDCEIHKASTSINWMMNVAEQHVSGILAASLVLRQAGSLGCFREHLFEEIKSSLLVVHGNAPTGAAQEYRKQIYDLFLSSDLSRQEDVNRTAVRRATQRAILDRFLCGDLQGSTVQFFTGGLDVSTEDVLTVIRSHVMPALLPTSMPTYARHRWLGGEQAVEWVSLLEAHNRLFSRTIRRMFRTEDDGVKDAAPRLALTGWAALEAQAIGPEPAEGNPAVDSVLEEQVIDNQEPSARSEMDWAEFNKSMQKKLKAWVRNDLGILPLLRHAMTISSRLMFRLLKKSGRNWDVKQQAAASQGQPHKYRLAECYIGLDVSAAFDQMEAAFQQLPPAVPMLSRTRAHRVVMFLLLSRLSGALHFFLRGLRDGCPFKLAELLEDPTEFSARIIFETKPCMRDTFTAAMLEKFPSIEELLSKEAQSIIHAAFDLSEADVASIESRHASVRRLLDCKSTSWSIILQTLSADFLCRQTALEMHGIFR